MTANSTTLKDLEAARRSNGEFGTQTHADPGIVVFVMPPGSHYVYIETDDQDLDVNDIVVGPFPSEIAAQRAMDHSVLIQGLVEENCLECYVDQMDTVRADVDHIVPDETPSNTGEIDITDLIEDLRNVEFPWVEVDDYQGPEGDKFAV